MPDKPVIIPAQLSKFTTLADRTMKFQVNTNELTPEVKAKLFGYEQSLGWLFFSPTEMTEVEIPMDKPEFLGAKTPSQRLYNKMFRLFKVMQDRKLINESASFEDFRKKEIEKLVNAYDRRISEL